MALLKASCVQQMGSFLLLLQGILRTESLSGSDTDFQGQRQSLNTVFRPLAAYTAAHFILDIRIVKTSILPTGL